MSYSPEDVRAIRDAWARRGPGGGPAPGACVVLDSAASTQDELRARLAEGEGDVRLVVASTQTRGRGTRGRRWEQATHDDLSFSISVRATDEARFEALLLPMLAAAAIRSGLLEACAELAREPGRLRLKWPNDVLLDGRKLAGILIESAGPAHWIVGVGINVGRRAFSPELATTATSLALALASPAERAAVLCAVLRTWHELFAAAVHGRAAAVIALYEEGLGLSGQRVRVRARGVESEGVLAGVDPQAVRLADGRSFAPGEVEALSRSSTG